MASLGGQCPVLHRNGIEFLDPLPHSAARPVRLKPEPPEVAVKATWVLVALCLTS
ncbi:hypothetical protein JYK02_05045 [Corallococcus macrosporus]|uniref:Uncharacterized protein n=1 Tax=Corallococcus macrosporus TaxID=35 RepID=A0ABS3D5D7_9BACT|nr:hypothetical protein [Corallococcus macrosporus]MBN8226874.1 hypothetical protein [Corallococcus macrosporus]